MGLLTLLLLGSAPDSGRQKPRRAGKGRKPILGGEEDSHIERRKLEADPDDAPSGLAQGAFSSAVPEMRRPRRLNQRDLPLWER